jgi:hypothetical protein
MAKGDKAKSWVTEKILECFGQDRAFVSDKKIYINTEDNGEPVQICIALTCPKTIVGAQATKVTTTTGGVDFGAFAEPATTAPEPYQPAEITSDERQRVLDLMKALNL